MIIFIHKLMIRKSNEIRDQKRAHVGGIEWLPFRKWAVEGVVKNNLSSYNDSFTLSNENSIQSVQFYCKTRWHRGYILVLENNMDEFFFVLS